MRKNILLLILMSVIGINISAQQALWDQKEIVSPEINSDNTVTFRFQAENAKEVKLSGDWMPAEGWIPGSVQMTKGEKGIWTYTTEVLPSELYSYSFNVDGLRCPDPNNVHMIRDVASVTNVFIIGKGQADLYKVNNVPHGTVARRWYDSPCGGMKRRLTIYTPAGYETSKEKYPVLYLLHGIGGDEEAWIALGRTAQIMDNLIAQGKAKPMIVVMTNGNIAMEAAPGEGSEGFVKPTMKLPHTMDGKFEECFPDIIKFVESSYRINTDRSNRAIAGLSMGGFHSGNISRYYPKTFDYVGLFSAAFLSKDQMKQMGNPDSKVYQNMDEKLKAQMDNGFKLYWIGMGKSDFLYKSCVEYRDKLDKMGMKYTYMETEGGHTWRNWRVYLSNFVPLLFK